MLMESPNDKMIKDGETETKGGRTPRNPKAEVKKKALTAFYFPQYHITIVAETKEEAEKQLPINH